MNLKRYIQRMGSKNSVAVELFYKIIELVPNHSNLIFVDLFGGGGSMSSTATQCFKSVIYNEIDKGCHDLFLAVQDDEFIKQAKSKWISRDDFFKLDPSIIEDNLYLTIFSFGNNRSGYMYGKQIERRRELTHKICFSKTEEEYKSLIKQYNDEEVAHFEKYGASWSCFIPDNDRDIFKDQKNRRTYKFGKKSKYTRKFYKEFDIDELVEKRGKMLSKMNRDLIQDIKKAQSLESLESLERLQSLESLERLERLQSLESLESLQRLERLQSLESLESLETNNKSYEEVELPKPNECVIYLDPPYRNTTGYELEFDFDKFDKYVLDLKNKGYTIFLSEYNFPFGDIIWSKDKRGFVSQTKDNMTGKEKLYYISENKQNKLF